MCKVARAVTGRISDRNVIQVDVSSKQARGTKKGFHKLEDT